MNNIFNKLSAKMMAIISLAAGVLSMLFMFATEVLTYKVGNMKMTYKYFEFLDLGAGSDKAESALIVAIIAIIFGVIGLLLMIAPVMSGKAKGLKGSAITRIVYMVAMLIAVYGILSQDKPDSIKFGFAFIGWLALIFGIVGVVFAIAAAKASKE